jgi:hypothetical protein
VCSFVQKDLCLNKIDISYNCQEKDLEIYAVEVETEASKLNRLSLYRALSGDCNQFINSSDGTVRCLCNPISEFIIYGDKNTDYLI